MAKVCVVVALFWLPYFIERLSFGCSALSSEIAFENRKFRYSCRRASSRVQRVPVVSGFLCEGHRSVARSRNSLARLMI